MPQDAISRHRERPALAPKPVSGSRSAALEGIASAHDRLQTLKARVVPPGEGEPADVAPRAQPAIRRR